MEGTMPNNPRSSDRKVAANRFNSKKSPGPQNTTSTRYNATKHSLLAAGITELDNSDGYREMLRRLDRHYAAEMIAFLKGHIVLKMVRLRRNARLEAEHVTSLLNPAIYGKVEDHLLKDILPPTAPLVDPGLPASISSESVAILVSSFQRYETSVENQMYRAMHEVERLEQIMKGKHLPAPVVADIAVHSDRHNVAANVAGTNTILEAREQFGPEIEEAKLDSSDLDSSGDAQRGAPSGTDGHPSQEPPVQAAVPEGSEYGDHKSETDEQGRVAPDADVVCEDDVPEGGKTAT
jgi:hypothetical protein